jgi:TolB-like protein
MSPEQASGSDMIDRRSDIYSLGCVLYEMLSGQPPFTGTNPQAIVARHLSERPPSIRVVRPSVPLEVEAVIERSLEKVPADRFDTATQLDQHLAGIGQGPVAVRYREEAGVRSLATRTTMVVAGMIAVIAATVVVARSLRMSDVSDVGVDIPGVLGLAVFPFRTSDENVAQWSEALPDFLATALDGTVGIRVSDPWSLWHSLRAPPDARARNPDPADAARLAARAGATQFVLGSIVRGADAFNLNIRIYSTEDAETLYSAAFQAPLDNVLAITQDLAAHIITSALESDTTLHIPALEHSATTSADALKAYLDARESMRRGLISSANSLIDRSLDLDSTFALALVEATVIKSWVQYVEGRLVPDLLSIAERAVAHSESLGERNRQRARTVLASIRTDGVAAAEASERILQHDSTDLEAWASLAYSHQAYGWQYGKRLKDAIVAAEHVVSLDSTYVPGLVVRAELAAASSDSGDMRQQLTRLHLADTTNALVRGAMLGLRSILEEESTFAVTASQLANVSLEVWITSYRMVRVANPGRAERLAELLERAGRPGLPYSSAIRARALLLLTQGRFRTIDSMLVAGAFQNQEFEWTLERIMVAASVAGLVSPRVVTRAVESLTASIPLDSAVAYLESKPVLRTGWVLAAYSATNGDTVVAKRWHSVFGEFPVGGPQRDYRRSIQLDIESRLAERVPDLERALDLAQQAYDLWTIHSSNALEDQPEPGMRFHLASLLRENSREDDAASIFRSLTPPVTWLGFYTALAWLELGELVERSGDLLSSAHLYRMARDIWEQGRLDVSVPAERAAAGMRRVTAPH